MVYTRSWVVNLILDLAGYCEEKELASHVAVEPAAGAGAFLEEMVRRLLASCRRHGLPIAAGADALQAFELDERSATTARIAIRRILVDNGTSAKVAEDLVYQWVRNGDYLLEQPQLSPADFVIGNPPYIRLEDVPEPLTALYRKMYRTMLGRADLYIAFFEAALRQLNPGGVCGFICADRWMRNHYGAELRRFVTTNFNVETVIEMHRASAFHAEVSAYPAVTIIRKNVQGPVIVASVDQTAGGDRDLDLAQALRGAADAGLSQPPPLGFRAARVEGWFRDSEPWPSVSPPRLSLLRHLEARFDPLEDPAAGTRISIGVATGADKIFVTKDPHLVEPSRLLPLAMASDMPDGILKWSGHYLVDPWQTNGRLVDLGDFPRLRAYFVARRDMLAERHVAIGNPLAWYRTIDAVHHELTTRSKLYLPDIKGSIHPVLDEGKTYPHHNLYVVLSTNWNMEILGGLLLSSVAQFFIECYAVRMRGGFLRFQAQYLRRIRVPRPSDISHDAAERLITAFRTRDIDLANTVAFVLYGIDHIPPEVDLGS